MTNDQIEARISRELHSIANQFAPARPTLSSEYVGRRSKTSLIFIAAVAVVIALSATLAYLGLRSDQQQVTAADGSADESPVLADPVALEESLTHLADLSLGQQWIWPSANDSAVPYDSADEALSGFLDAALMGSYEYSGDPAAPPNGPVWYTVALADDASIEVLLTPTMNDGWVIRQIGTTPTSVQVDEDSVFVRIPPLEAAEWVVVAYTVGRDTILSDVVSITGEEAGSVMVDAPPVSHVVVYFDEEGSVVGLSGGGAG